jgi:hypothetical protein
MNLVYLLVAAIAVLFAGNAMRNRKRESKAYIGAVLGSAIACFVALFAAIFIGGAVPDKTVTDGPWNLVAMRSSDAAAGTFVWGTGTIHGELVYNVYVKNADGSMTPYQIAGDRSVRIIEDPNLSNTGTWQQVVNVPDTSSTWARWTIFPEMNGRRVAGNVLKVPVGTVRQTFEVK